MTRQIRVFADLADKIGEIIDVEGGSIANLVDDWLRPHVEARYAAVKPQIDLMKAARAQGETDGLRSFAMMVMDRSGASPFAKPPIRTA